MTPAAPPAGGDPWVTRIDGPAIGVGDGEFAHRFTVIPDSGDVELHCSSHSPMAHVWQVGYHPSLDILVAHARAHNADEHEDRSGRPQEAATPVEALAAEWERLVAEHSQKAAEYDRDHEMECFHRGCAAGLTVAAKGIRERLAELRELAASWAEPVKMATATHDELVEQAEREDCARGLLAILGEAPDA